MTAPRYLSGWLKRSPQRLRVVRKENMRIRRATADIYAAIAAQYRAVGNTAIVRDPNVARAGFEEAQTASLDAAVTSVAQVALGRKPPNTSEDQINRVAEGCVRRAQEQFRTHGGNNA